MLEYRNALVLGLLSLLLVHLGNDLGLLVLDCLVDFGALAGLVAVSASLEAMPSVSSLACAALYTYDSGGVLLQQLGLESVAVLIPFLLLLALLHDSVLAKAASYTIIVAYLALSCESVCNRAFVLGVVGLVAVLLALLETLGLVVVVLVVLLGLLLVALVDASLTDV